MLCESHVCPFSMHGNSYNRIYLFPAVTSSVMVCPHTIAPLMLITLCVQVFSFLYYCSSQKKKKKISQVYDDVYCHSLSNATFIVRWWGWGGLREWSGGGGGGGCCAWSICLVKQLCIRWMSKSKGGGGGSLCGRLTPAFVVSYCLVPTWTDLVAG